MATTKIQQRWWEEARQMLAEYIISGIFSKNTKLDKQFLQILTRRKWGRVGDIITEMGFLQFDGNIIQNLHEEYKRVELICRTAYFLERHELVTVARHYAGGFIPTFNPSKFDGAANEKDYLFERLEYINQLMKQYWDREVHIVPGFYSFVDNGFKTDEEIKEQRQFWLSIGIAVLASFLTALFTAFLPKIFSI